METSEEKAENDGKLEMVSELKYLIVASISVNDVPSIPPRNKINTSIGSAEAIKSTNIDDAETVAAGASSAAKLMEQMTTMSLNISRGKPGKYVGLE